MSQKWSELLAHAGFLVDYLNRLSYFDSKYSGRASQRMILTDGHLAFRYASADSFEAFDDWATVSDSPNIFPDDFEWKTWIDHNLLRNGCFGLASKNFNGADMKWTQSGICMLYELMYRDMRILFNCYANNFFPNLWGEILDVYLSDGFPCGWHGRFPQGGLVVFSNF